MSVVPNLPHRHHDLLRPLGLACALMTMTGPVWAAGQPLWGYGVRGCTDYVQAATTPEAGELVRYQDWLTGFLSGLNLATGEDVLHGGSIDQAMDHALGFCKGKSDADFFNAAMDFVRAQRVLKKK